MHRGERHGGFQCLQKARKQCEDAVRVEVLPSYCAAAAAMKSDQKEKKLQHTFFIRLDTWTWSSALGETKNT